MRHRASPRPYKDYEEALRQVYLGLDSFPGNRALIDLRSRIKSDKAKSMTVQAKAMAEQMTREQKFQAFMNEANDLLREGELEAAKSELEEAFKYEASGVQAKRMLRSVRLKMVLREGEEKSKVGAYDEAIKAFRKAKRFDEGCEAEAALNKSILAKGEGEIQVLIAAGKWPDVVSRARELQMYGSPRARIKAFERRKRLEMFRDDAVQAFTKDKDFQFAANLLENAAKLADEEELKASLTTQAKNYLFRVWVDLASVAEGKNEWATARAHLKSALDVRDGEKVRQRWVRC